MKTTILGFSESHKGNRWVYLEIEEGSFQEFKEFSTYLFNYDYYATIRPDNSIVLTTFSVDQEDLDTQIFELCDFEKGKKIIFSIYTYNISAYNADLTIEEFMQKEDMVIVNG